MIANPHSQKDGIEESLRTLGTMSREYKQEIESTQRNGMTDSQTKLYEFEAKLKALNKPYGTTNQQPHTQTNR